ncbi:MAG: DUF3179 domain-containing protein [Armatimonadetes bacterium]|nr:DUF3179 domain-containing protein [Armatimonadota bacterium]
MRRGAVVTVLVGTLIATAALAGTWGGQRGQAVAQGLPFDGSEWKTNFKKSSVPLNEIRSGGPPKDGIPAIDRPKFETVADAAKWLKPAEPVVIFERGSDARAYPLQILIWHEIVNDTVGGVPGTVTFCPLCNTSITFDRRLEGQVYDFGTTGKLYKSALVMYDRQTESWWWQVSGEGIVGDLTGKRLTVLPSQIISWEIFRRARPSGKVLSRDTGHSRPYGRNPYVGYDDINSSPFLYTGGRDPRLRPMERVVTVSIGGQDVAYPFSALEKVGVVHDTVGGVPIVVFFQKGTASALDAGDIASGRDVGATGVFLPVVDGRRLSFAVRGVQFGDEQTKSTWNILGHAAAGPLAGKRLEPIVHGNHFWFSWSSYRPQTRVWQP